MLSNSKILTSGYCWGYTALLVLYIFLYPLLSRHLFSKHYAKRDYYFLKSRCPYCNGLKQYDKQEKQPVKMELFPVGV